MVLTLKVKIIPDMEQFRRDLSKGVSGVGGGRGRKATGKSSEVQISGFGKLLKFAAITAALSKGLEFFIKPVMQLLSVVLALLFLPLIPILKPVLIGLGKFVKEFAKFQRKSKEGWELFLSGKAWDVLKNTIVNGLSALRDRLLSGLISLGQTFVGAINKIPGVNIPIPRNPFLQSSGGGGGVVPSPSRNNMSTPTSPVNAPAPINISFPNMSVASTHDANTIADRVLSILKSGLTRTLPLLR